MDKDESLQMSVKAINDSVGPDSLVSTLLVCGALACLGLPTGHPFKSTFQLADALQDATAAMSKLFAKRQARKALHTRNEPNETDMHMIPVGSSVSVFWPENNNWKVPYSMFDLKGEKVIILMHESA